MVLMPMRYKHYLKNNIMKKYLLIGLIILVIGSMVIIPMVRNSSSNDTEYDSSLPSEFTFEQNLAIRYNETVELSIQVNQAIQKLELAFGDTILKSWNNPKQGIITLNFNPSMFGIGTKPISLISKLTNGTSVNDNRMVRVLSDIVPNIWTAKIKRAYPHSTTHYTQGLEFLNNDLYEGTGQYGSSKITKVDLQTGKPDDTKSITLAGNYFGEGITILGNKVYQLTWQEQTCFIYNLPDFKLEKSISYVGEGWGLCNDGKYLIMSNGTERITFRNPETFAIEKTIEVFDNTGPVSQLNELEYIEGKIYANVYTTTKIAVIDPLTGRVESIIEAGILEKEGRGFGDVLNGIAYNDGKIYMTGKNWNKLFEVELVKP